MMETISGVDINIAKVDVNDPCYTKNVLVRQKFTNHTEDLKAEVSDWWKLATKCNLLNLAAYISNNEVTIIKTYINLLTSLG